ncbi:glycosyltransferase family 4 protein [bacterium]|nr:glycosyltransferase family 4 protein [bacterium]
MRIGQISFRLAGSDGVSLEAAKLTQILAQMGHANYYLAGELDPRSKSSSLTQATLHGAALVPEAHFTHPEAVWLTEHAFGSTTPHPDFHQRLQAFSERIEAAILDFIQSFRIDVLVAQNILAIPMNIALSTAFVRVVKSTGIPAIAHHHDFYWEREAYRVNCIPDLLAENFPPDLSNLRHMVINSSAQAKLAEMGIESTILPNVLDFSAVPPRRDAYNKDLRQEIGLEPDDIFFLQPTRVIPRKGIELAVELVEKLADPRIKLVITHQAEYNTTRYLEEICALAAKAHVPLYYLPARFQPNRREGTGIHKVYSLWDAYIHADFVTYPSLYEGFGNALVEALYFRKPMLVNRYAIFRQDIEPTGIQVVKIDGQITDAVVSEVRSLLDDKAKAAERAKINVQIAKEHFSYKVAVSRLDHILQSF